MPASTAFSNILPDPSNPINDAGQASASDSAPGFSTVKLASESKTIFNSTNSGRLITSASGGHKWSVDVTYNPLTRDDFEPVFNFLLHKKGRLTPFFMSLPQNKLPRDGLFSTFVTSNDNFVMYTSPVLITNLEVNREYKIQFTPADTNFVTVGAGSDVAHVTFTATSTGTGTGLAAPTYEPAGQDNINISNVTNSYTRTTHGTPKPGDVFTVVDSNDALHTKLYKITRVETPDHYETAVPVQQVHSLPEQTPNEADVTRIYFTPALQRTLYSGASIKFYDPKIRVVMTDDIQEYSLNNDNLYTFALKLEEAQK
jgi:hypothetical protein